MEKTTNVFPQCFGVFLHRCCFYCQAGRMYLHSWISTKGSCQQKVPHDLYSGTPPDLTQGAEGGCRYGIDTVR